MVLRGLEQAVEFGVFWSWGFGVQGFWSFGVSSSSAARISARLLGGWYMRLLLLLIITCSIMVGPKTLF